MRCERLDTGSLETRPQYRARYQNVSRVGSCGVWCRNNVWPSCPTIQWNPLLRLLTVMSTIWAPDNQGGSQGAETLRRVVHMMASRAVHIEVADTLETHSFISALQRFVCRRGPIRQLQSDQGTNFVGARRELKAALEEFDHTKIRSELQRHDCDWFEFNMNVPSASHMGGAWERQIRSVRSVLASLLQNNGSQLNDESLRTLLCEAGAIVNSRPLTVESLNDPLSLNPLTPSHLLTMKTKVVLPPPGVFQSADKYCRKRWRRVQHLANEF